jgi:hypothetical protein
VAPAATNELGREEGGITGGGREGSESAVDCWW